MRTKRKDKADDGWRGHLTIPRMWSLLSVAVVAINILVLLAGVYWATSFPREMEKVWNSLDDTFQISSSIQYYPRLIRNAFVGMVKKGDGITVDVSHKNIQKLEFMRREAFDGRRDFKFVPAEIRYAGETVKVKIRLKGDRSIHWESLDTASFRIRVRGEKTLLGMRTFSLHKPRARNHIHEWIFLQMVRYEGLIAPRYVFLRLTINGKDLGIYALEEHYDKRLIEAHGYREGPIIRFDEDTDRRRGSASMLISPFQAKRWSQPGLRRMAGKAVHLLEGYRRGDLRAGQVFDLKKLATFFAITDITGTHHAAVPKSVRFYYNPISSRLEPVAFDGHLGTVDRPVLSSELGITPGTWIYSEFADWFKKFFNDPRFSERQFLREYVAALERLSSPGHLEQFFADIDGDLNRNLDLIYGEFPLKDNIFSFGPAPFIFDDSPYFERRKYISKTLRRAALTAHLLHIDGDRLVVEVETVDRELPMEVLSISCGDQVAPVINPENLLSVSSINETKRSNFEFQSAEGWLAQEDRLPCLQLNYRLPGQSVYRSTRVFPWKRFDPHEMSEDPTITGGNFRSFDFIQVDESNRTLTISTGKHRLARNLIIPEGYRVSVSAGTELILENDAMIYSRSPLHMIGTEERPVRISSDDGSGQGIALVGAGELSVFEHVDVRNITSANQGSWALTGSLTFYESPVNMSYVSFTGIKSEDALNIVRSRFLLNEIRISKTRSDGIDIDFGNGELRNSRIYDTGNDAIDVSGTEITLEDITVASIGDKGLSAGERSRVKGENLKIDNAYLGVASKDSASVRLNRVVIGTSRFGLAAYQKKSEYGPGSIDLRAFRHDDLGVRSVVEIRSNLMIDGQRIPGDKPAVESFLYGDG